MAKPVTSNNPASWLAAVWEAIHMAELSDAQHVETEISNLYVEE